MLISHCSFHFLNNARNIQNIKNNKPSGGNKHVKNTNIINIKQPILFHLLSHLIFDKLILTYYNLLVNKKLKKKEKYFSLYISSTNLAKSSGVYCGFILEQT